MVQGTMSGAGKSLLCAALCRIFARQGLRVAPFKSQNMALNSCVTDDGLEMGRAQAVQAAAAGKRPDVRMNPVLLKPCTDTGSQVIVNGIARSEMGAAEYYEKKASLIPDVLAAYHSLAEENDVIVIEGAGSPAEINLRENDFVNMGLASMVDAPVLLAGDIDRGGVFAQLVGTAALLEPEETARIKGFLINKFRGDPAILQHGLDLLEQRTGIPVLGVIPYLDVDIDEEDSLAPRLAAGTEGVLDVAVIRFPRISNFTDLAPLEAHPQFGVRYVERVQDLGSPDLIILPGTKSTTPDLLWMRESGLEAKVLQCASRGTPVIGICGGFQMLGRTVEEEGPSVRGLGLLPVDTVFQPDKKLVRTETTVRDCPFLDGALNGLAISGYEIHQGRTSDGIHATDTVLGSYLHGFFDRGDLVEALADALSKKKGVSYVGAQPVSHAEYLDTQLNILADGVEAACNMEALWELIQ